MAQHTDTITCVFDLRRVIYETVVEGNIEKWDMASGEITFVNSKVQINKGRWYMGGLQKTRVIFKRSKPKLISTGHLVGKMAYFNLSVDKGEAPRAPSLYRSASTSALYPLWTIKTSATAKAEIWTDVEDWAGGVLTLVIADSL